KAGHIPGEKVEILGHTSPWVPDQIGGGTANLAGHFPDDHSARHLHLLTRALPESGRTDTNTANLCVLTPPPTSLVETAGELLLSDDAAAWERLLRIQRRPATVVISPQGEVVWRHEGEIDSGGMAATLRTHLAPGGQFFPQFIQSSLRIGQPAP